MKEIQKFVIHNQFLLLKILNKLGMTEKEIQELNDDIVNKVTKYFDEKGE